MLGSTPWDGPEDRVGVPVAGIAGVVILLTIGTAGAAFAGAAGATSAGDQPTVIYSAEETYTAAQGERVAIPVRVSSDGGVGDVGVEEIELVAAYDEAKLTAVDVEPASWLEGDEPTTVETETTIDDDSGEVTVRQWRDPPAGGTTGDELFATLTFEVNEDAQPGNTTLTFDNTEVRLTDQYPVPIFGEETTLTIQESQDGAGGGSGISTTLVVGGLAAAGALLVLGAIGVRRL